MMFLSATVACTFLAGCGASMKPAEKVEPMGNRLKSLSTFAEASDVEFLNSLPNMKGDEFDRMQLFKFLGAVETVTTYKENPDDEDEEPKTTPRTDIIELDYNSFWGVNGLLWEVMGHGTKKAVGLMRHALIDVVREERWNFCAVETGKPYCIVNKFKGIINGMNKRATELEAMLEHRIEAGDFILEDGTVIASLQEAKKNVQELPLKCQLIKEVIFEVLKFANETKTKVFKGEIQRWYDFSGGKLSKEETLAKWQNNMNKTLAELAKELEQDTG